MASMMKNAEVADKQNSGLVHPSIAAATAGLRPFSTLDEVRATIRRSRSFCMERIAEGDFVAVQAKPGTKGSRLLISADSVREWLERSLVRAD